MEAEWKRNGSGMEAEWKRNGSGIEAEWKRNGSGITITVSLCELQCYSIISMGIARYARRCRLLRLFVNKFVTIYAHKKWVAKR